VTAVTSPGEPEKDFVPYRARRAHGKVMGGGALTELAESRRFLIETGSERGAGVITELDCLTASAAERAAVEAVT
jgi:hypothetical protein